MFKQIIIGTSVFATSVGVTFFTLKNTNGGNSSSNEITSTSWSTKSPIKETAGEKLLGSLLSYEAMDINGDIKITLENREEITLKLDGQGTIADISNIQILADMKLKMLGLEIGGQFSYFTDTMTFSVDEICNFKLKTNDLLDFIQMIPTYGVEIALPESLNSLDTNTLLNKITSIEEEDVRTLPTGERFYTVTLGENEEAIAIDVLANEEDEIKGIKIDRLEYQGTEISLHINLDEISSDELTITNPLDKEDAYKYQDFKPAFTLIDNFYNLTKQSQFGLKITADLANNGQKLLDSEIAVNVDKDNNNLGLDISLFSKEDTDGNKKKYTINTAYLDGVIYAKYHNVKVSIPSSTISRMISYAYDQVKDQLSAKINEVLDGGLDMGNIDINGIFADVKNTLKKVNVSNGSFDIVLNIDHFNKYIDSENPILPSENIVLTVNFDDHKITSISLSTINISTFSINLGVEFTDYQTITVDNPESYVDLDESEILIESVLEFINEKKYYLGIDIDTDDHDSSTNDLTFDGEIQLNFTGDNHYGYGEATIVDSNKYRHNLKADMYNQGNFIFSYNDKLKGSFTSQTIFDIADLVKEIIANPDEHFVELFGELLEKLNSTTLNRIIAGEYTLALDYEIISNLDINRSKTSFDLNLAIFGMDDITMHIEIGYTNDDVNYEYANLDYLSITNLSLLGKDVSVRLNFDKYQDTNSTKLNDSRRLNQFDTYLDFSCIKTLLALGLNTSKFNYYHFTGKLNATLPIIPDIKDLGLDAKIKNDHGDVTVMIGLTNIPVLSLFGGKIDGYDSTDESARKAYIYYQHYEDKDKTDFWYIDRQDTVANKGSKVDGHLWWATYNYTEYTHHTMRKCTNEYFLDNILDILIHDVLGINSSLLDKALNSESSSSTAIKYEDILSDFSYSENKHSFFFDIDLNALVGMNIFNKFELTVTEDPDENILDGVGVKLNLLLNLVKVDFTLKFEDDRYVDISNITIPEADNYIALHSNDAYDQASTTEAVYSRSYVA